MPGLPPIPYDPGEDIPQCLLFFDTAPRRIKCTVTGVKSVFFPETLDTFSETMKQQTNASEYQVQTATPERFAFYRLIPRPIPPQLSRFLLQIEFSQTVFFSFFDPPCNINGTFESIFTVNSPSAHGYYSGTLEISPG